MLCSCLAYPLQADSKRLSKTINSATENNGNAGKTPQGNKSSKTAIFMDEIAGYSFLGRRDSTTLQQGGKKIGKSGSIETKFNDGADHTEVKVRPHSVEMKNSKETVLPAFNFLKE